MNAGENYDNSLAALMVIKDKKVYLIQDGYDNPEQVAHNKAVLDRGNQFVPDMWQNKIDATAPIMSWSRTGGSRCRRNTDQGIRDPTITRIFTSASGTSS